MFLLLFGWMLLPAVMHLTLKKMGREGGPEEGGERARWLASDGEGIREGPGREGAEPVAGVCVRVCEKRLSHAGWGAVGGGCLCRALSPLMSG